MTRETKMSAPNSQTRAALHDFLSAFEQFKSANDQRLSEIEKRRNADVLLEEKVARIDAALTRQKAALDRMHVDASRPALSGRKGVSQPGWNAYVRRGDASALIEAKALSAGSPGDGGYVAPPETEALINRLISESSPIRAIASVRQTTSHTFRKPVSLGGAAAGWSAETGSRTETNTPELTLIEFPTAELYAMPAATPVILDDALADVDQWLAEEVRDVFAAEEGKAFVSGNGTNQPRGFLSYDKEPEGTQSWGEIGYVASGAAGDFDEDPVDALIDLVYAPATAYRANARFVMNRQTVSRVRKLKDADGHYIWQPSTVAGEAASLMGYPLTEAEDMPDIGANQFAIAFGDFERGYLVVDRQGIEVLRDPYSAKPYVLFYTTKRVGGGVQDFNAIKLMKFAEE
ncbi:MAG: phage major capsid protein [Oceanicaulis sp.]|uniref:phage major capsid protein n=1 Tax=Glycocaulis sp. TaxID=1969725 RepID=UPI0025C07A01|nr:phage major capsid protein [Glycocaulis sp.]MCC5980350.1 phage major capsid protein [Oceanicaulis sp.]MCH8522230.1 phage major capsid protein [Glycocaulis sp.]